MSALDRVIGSWEGSTDPTTRATVADACAELRGLRKRCEDLEREVRGRDLIIDELEASITLLSLRTEATP